MMKMKTRTWAGLLAGGLMMSTVAVEAQETPDFSTVQISIVVAKRHSVAINSNEETQNEAEPANRAAHLEGLATGSVNGEANTSSSTVTIDESDGDDGDGFIDMEQKNPGRSGANGKNPDVPTGHLRINELSYVNNSYVGDGLFIFDSDGDGKVGADEDDEGNPQDLNGDGFDDDDQIMPVTVRVNLRSNAHGAFLRGSVRALFDGGTSGQVVDTDGDGEPDDVESGTPQTQPRVQGQIRTVSNSGTAGAGNGKYKS